MSPTAREIETEVAIIGAGPVGLCLAVDLAWRGIECVVVERRHEGAPTFPTANHIGARTMEHLRRLGLADQVRGAFRTDWGGDWVALTHLGGHEDALAGSAARDDSPEHEVWAPKPCFDPILFDAAASSATTTLVHGLGIDAVTDDGETVVCEGLRRNGAAVRVRAGYAIGCDGASSTIRSLRGIAMDGPPPLPVTIHSAYFRSSDVAELVPHGGVQYLLLGTEDGPTTTPVGAGVMVAVDGYDRWRLHGPGLDADDEAKTLARLRELGAGDAEILALSAWTPRQG